MDIEQRVNRIERWIATDVSPEFEAVDTEIRRDLAARTDPFRAQVERDAIVDGLRAQVAELRGAMAAQDQREWRAADRCGVPYEQSGCDWPDAVADEVLSLLSQRDAAVKRAEEAERERDEARAKDHIRESLSEAVQEVHIVLDGGGVPAEVNGSDSFVLRTKFCVSRLKTKHDILTAAREAFNGGESSESDFAEHLAQYMKACTSRTLQLREDVGNWQKRAEALTAERDEANRLLGEVTEALSRTVTERDIARDEKAEPVPMILACPECCERHIDRGEFAERPHHTHACQSCGFVWRPAVVATVGVHFLPGFRDPEVAMVSSRFGMSTANINAAEPEPS